MNFPNLHEKQCVYIAKNNAANTTERNFIYRYIYLAIESYLTRKGNSAILYIKV